MCFENATISQKMFANIILRTHFIYIACKYSMLSFLPIMGCLLTKYLSFTCSCLNLPFFMFSFNFIGLFVANICSDILRQNYCQLPQTSKKKILQIILLCRTSYSKQSKHACVSNEFLLQSRLTNAACV